MPVALTGPSPKADRATAIREGCLEIWSDTPCRRVADIAAMAAVSSIVAISTPAPTAAAARVETQTGFGLDPPRQSDRHQSRARVTGHRRDQRGAGRGGRDHGHQTPQPLRASEPERRQRWMVGVGTVDVPSDRLVDDEDRYQTSDQREDRQPRGERARRAFSGLVVGLGIQGAEPVSR